MMVWGLVATVAIGSGTWLYLHVKAIGAAEERRAWQSVIDDKNVQLEKVARAATEAYDEADAARKQIKVEVVKEIETIEVPVAAPGQQRSAPSAIPRSTIDKLNKIK